DWSIPEIVHSASGRLAVIPNIWQLNPSNVGLYATLHGARVQVVWLSEESAADRLEQCDYILARTHLESADRVAPLERKIAEYMRANSDRFKPAAVFALPGAQEAVLYKRTSLVL